MITGFPVTPLAAVSPLRDGEVHLWKVPLAQVATQTPDHLNGVERARFDRFHRPADAHRFRARRSVLRSVLSAYLGCAPTDVSFGVQDAAGKPMLEGIHRGALEFNASSSADIALIALAVSCSIGVDVEAARPIDDMDKIAARFFGPDETERLIARPPDQRRDAFFRLWTSKEALLKAAGTGLPGGLDRFVVSEDPTTPPKLLHDAKGAGFHLYPADPEDRYFGALAAEVDTLRVVRFSFDPKDAG